MYVATRMESLSSCRSVEPGSSPGRVLLLARSVLLAAVLFSSSGVFAQKQPEAPPRKAYHPPRTLPLTKFYDTPEPLPAGKPGELIRFEQAYEYHLSYEASKYRILYHSVSPQGKDVAVSGVVLVPDGTPPKGRLARNRLGSRFHRSSAAVRAVPVEKPE